MQIGDALYILESSGYDTIISGFNGKVIKQELERMIKLRQFYYL